MVQNLLSKGFLLPYTFRNNAYACEFFIDSSAAPCFIFVFLKDKDLIAEFGEDITIKTDGNNRLPKKDDYPELVALRQTLFDVIKKTPAFLSARTVCRLSAEAGNNIQHPSP